MGVFSSVSPARGILLSILLAMPGAVSMAEVPVVPGAFGFGMETPAGRGGTIYRVTNLATSGEGSLKDCVTGHGPRVCVFEISGTIRLTEGLSVNHPFLTIAGETAPSPGITLRGQRFAINTHDVLIRHLRIRPGDEAGGQPQGIIVQNTGNDDVYNVVIDHCSITWAIDENIATWGFTDQRVHDVTVSRSIIAEGLDDSTHPEGPHSKGLIVGDGNRRIAILDNLFAHNADRNPEVKGGGTVVVANNVIYNWDPRLDATELGLDEYLPGEATLASVVGNLYLRGPDMPAGETAHAVETLAAIPEGTRLYLADNRAEDLVLFRNNADFDPLVDQPPIWLDGYTPRPVDEVESSVLAAAGARPRDRDAVDRRIVDSVAQRGGRIIDSQTEVGGWPELPVNRRELTIPSNPHNDDDGDGYTRLEEWIHAKAAAIETGAGPLPGVGGLRRTDVVPDEGAK